MSAVLPWLLSPACGALVGFGLGRLAASTLVPSLVARSRPSPGAADGMAAERVSTWLLSIPLARIVPADGSPAALSLERTIADSLRTILGSRAAIYAVRDAVSKLVAGLAARNVGDVARELGLKAFLADKLLPALLKESTSTALSRAVAGLVAEKAGAALDDDVLRDVSGVFESYLPEAAEEMVRWLRSPATRMVLSDRGRELLPRILEKLSEMQKFLISAGQFDRRLDEKMPEIIDETIQAAEKLVRDPLQQKRMVGLFFDSARGWRDSLLVSATDTEVPRHDARHKLSEAAARLLERLLGRLDDPSTREALSRRADERLGEDRRTLGAFFRDVFGVLDSQIVEAVSSLALSVLTRPEAAADIARRICSIFFAYAKEHPDTTLASALGIDAERKRRLDDSLRAGISRAAETLVPLVMPAVGQGLASSRRFAGFVGLFGASVGLLAGLLAALLRLVD